MRIPEEYNGEPVPGRDIVYNPGERIIARDGKLYYENRHDMEPKQVPVSIGRVIRIGCHTITWEAYDILKKKIEEND